MPASATSVVAKLATNPATAQTVPKSLRPLREKAQSPSLFHAENAENAEHNQVTQQQRQYRISPRNLRPLREKKHRTVPYSTQRAQRTQNIPKYRNNKDSTENLRVICGLCVKKAQILPLFHAKSAKNAEFHIYHIMPISA